MDSQSQIRREVRQAFIWSVIPFLSLIALGKIVWTAVDEKQLTGTDSLTFVFLLAAFVACWILARKQYGSWLDDALQGNSEAGKILYSFSTPMFTVQYRSAVQAVQSLIGIAIWILLTIFAFITHTSSIIIFFYSGLIWFIAFSVFIKAQWYLFGSHGMWITRMGVKIYVAYTTIKRATIKLKLNTHQSAITFYFGGKTLFSENNYPALLPQEAADILKEFIPFDILQ